MRRTGRTGLSIAAVIAVVALGGCGSDDEDEAKKRTGPERGFAQETTSPEGTLSPGRVAAHATFDGSGATATFKTNGKATGPYTFVEFFVPVKGCEAKQRQIGLDSSQDPQEGKDRTFSVTGTWKYVLDNTPKYDPGSVKLTLSDDHKLATVTWNAFGCSPGGTNVRMKRHTAAGLD